MKTYKQIENGVITTIGKSSVIPSNGTEITEEKYNQLMAVIQSRPEDTLETVYYLSAETEEYVSRDTTHDEKVDWYVSAVVSEQMAIEEVPEEFRASVEAKLPQAEPAKYTLDEAAAVIASEVASDE